jgi:hypothetical protein
MIRTIASMSALAVALAGLAACTEQPQTATQRKSDEKIWAGTDNAFAAPGWKSGDQASWEEQLRKRAQAQNEYGRTQ